MDSAEIVELELVPQDQLYYVSRESGDDFSTRPYIMHTALYYALGLLPSRFRVSEQSPKYTSHFEEAEGTAGVYIHPATPIGQPAGRYTTRRFAVKPDTFRDRAEQENKNLKETGFQRFIDPGTRFQTFIRVPAGDSDAFASRLEGYCRVGKKMTATRVRTATHHPEVETGPFELTHPIGNVDLETDAYDVRGDVHFESMMPVNLLTGARLAGDHITVHPRFSDDEKVALPTHTQFLHEHQ